MAPVTGMTPVQSRVQRRQWWGLYQVSAAVGMDRLQGYPFGFLVFKIDLLALLRVSELAYGL